MFHYSLPRDPGVEELVLPDNDRILVFAISVAEDPDRDTDYACDPWRDCVFTEKKTFGIIQFLLPTCGLILLAAVAAVLRHRRKKR